MLSTAAFGVVDGLAAVMGQPRLVAIWSTLEDMKTGTNRSLSVHADSGRACTTSRRSSVCVINYVSVGVVLKLFNDTG